MEWQAWLTLAVLVAVFAALDAGWVVF